MLYWPYRARILPAGTPPPLPPRSLDPTVTRPTSYVALSCVLVATGVWCFALLSRCCVLQCIQLTRGGGLPPSVVSVYVPCCDLTRCAKALLLAEGGWWGRRLQPQLRVRVQRGYQSRLARRAVGACHSIAWPREKGCAGRLMITYKNVCTCVCSRACMSLLSCPSSLATLPRGGDAIVPQQRRSLVKFMPLGDFERDLALLVDCVRRRPSLGGHTSRTPTPNPPRTRRRRRRRAQGARSGAPAARAGASPRTPAIAETGNGNIN